MQLESTLNNIRNFNIVSCINVDVSWSVWAVLLPLSQPTHASVPQQTLVQDLTFVHRHLSHS